VRSKLKNKYGSGTSTILSGCSTVSTLTVNYTNTGATDTFSGIIGGTTVGTSRAIALTKSGNGVLSLTATNTYAGGTTINGGTIQITADSNLGTNASPLWRAAFAHPAKGITPVSSSDVGCGDLSPQIGITGTPVIDSSSGTLYVVAKTKEVRSGVTAFYQRLHALDLATLAEQSHSPLVVQASYPGTGAASSGGMVVFDPAQYKERAGLLLVNGTVYTAWASHCDIFPYTGWIIGYDGQTLAQTRVLNVVPNGSDGAIWQAGHRRSRSPRLRAACNGSSPRRRGALCWSASTNIPIRETNSKDASTMRS